MLNTITYGTSSAPYLAIKTLETLAVQDQHLYPKAAKILGEDFYVDDVMTGGEDKSEVLEIKDQLKNLLLE